MVWVSGDLPGTFLGGEAFWKDRFRLHQVYRMRKTRRPGVSRKTALSVGFKINSPGNQLLASGRFEEVVMSTKPEQQRPMPTRKNGRKSKPISR
jgi:hypothetical protein